MGKRPLGFPPRDPLLTFLAERVCWWGRPEPTPASRTSWKGAPSITVPGPPRALRSASRSRLTTPVSDICHAPLGTRVSKTRPVLESTPRSLCTHLACLGGLCCGLCRSLEKSAFFILSLSGRKMLSEPQRGNNILTCSIYMYPSNSCLLAVLR